MNQRLKKTLKRIAPRYVINRYNKLKDMMRIHKAAKMSCKPYEKASRPPGINLYADLCFGSGLSRSAVLLHSSIEAAGIACSVQPVEEFSGIPSLHEEASDYAINLFHVQPSQFSALCEYLPRERIDGHYNIVYWLWETPVFPPEWRKLCAMPDEIWTASEFTAASIRAVCDKPVAVYPCAVYQDREEEAGGVSVADMRKKYGIAEDCFVAFSLYDGRSSKERKNPEAAIRVFKKAFDQGGENVRMIVKSKGTDEKERAWLNGLMKSDPRFIHIQEQLPYEEAQELLKLSDVLISLHRAEGFGLTLAEKMSYGGVVLATDYSSTKEFVNEGNACTVSYRMVKTKKDHGPYRRGSIWAEPDEDEAARKLRRLYEDPALRTRLGAAARKEMQEKYTAEHIGKAIACRVQAICGGG